ncbi:hypothetical protein Tsubulata_033874 [Turnera subulata]|uniref:Uncharacterized protein n=1 Tax=Turnera subulata TaxID=218843 RepID=A0A9Q0GAG4_9ROSI|nr:hypothetical protein Tsubulata_033874 [Turnera subulata]
MVEVESFFNGNRVNMAHHPITLVSGPPSCGKTSLLFQFAYNAAALGDANTKVVFICNRRRIESNPPHLSKALQFSPCQCRSGIDASCDTFQRIQMKYVDDEEGIKKYFAAFHLYDTFPLAVVVDDFGDFFVERNCQERYGNPRGRDLAMVRVLALCHNAVMHANRRGPCSILLSDTHHGEFPRLLFIYKRWVQSVFTIKGDGNGSFLLVGNCNVGSENPERMRTAKYSIAFQYLTLEGISEDEEIKQELI